MRCRCLDRGAPYVCASDVSAPPNARLTDIYWQPPENAGQRHVRRRCPVRTAVQAIALPRAASRWIGGRAHRSRAAGAVRYEGPGLVGEKRMELNVVPAFAVSVSPRSWSCREARGQSPLVDPRAASCASPSSTAQGSGGGCRPAQDAGGLARITGHRRDKLHARRRVGDDALHGDAAGFRAAGEEAISAEVVSRLPRPPTEPPSGWVTRSIEYPHIQRRHKIIPAVARFKVIDVAIPPALTVGYIMGVGDQVPAALRQLGAHVTLIDSDEMAWGDLSRYNAIVTGVRAYEQRADLRANNHRLLKYVENGGTAIVQYNRTEFNQAQYGPYPAKTSAERITDENAPVKILAPGHPVFSVPNKLTDRDWQGWVQERGTYFLEEPLDAKYVDLIEMEDPFEYNKGPKRGALVEARYGKGRWVYVGLGLWRQLPSGTDGAYRLFANLISLGKPPARPRPVAVEK